MCNSNLQSHSESLTKQATLECFIAGSILIGFKEKWNEQIEVT